MKDKIIFALFILISVVGLIWFVLFTLDCNLHGTEIDRYSVNVVECTGLISECYDTVKYYHVALVDGWFGKYINTAEISYAEYYGHTNYGEYLK